MRKRSRLLYPNPRKLRVAVTENTHPHPPRQKGSGHQRERRKLTLLKITEGNEREVNLHGIGEEGLKIPHRPPEGGEGMTHVHPPLDETEGNILVHSLLPEDDAKIYAPLPHEGGESPIFHLHLLLGKDVGGPIHRRHEVGSVERKGCLPHPLVDVVGQVRRLLLLVV